MALGGLGSPPAPPAVWDTMIGTATLARPAILSSSLLRQCPTRQKGGSIWIHSAEVCSTLDWKSAEVLSTPCGSVPPRLLCPSLNKRARAPLPIPPSWVTSCTPCGADKRLLLYCPFLARRADPSRAFCEGLHCQCSCHYF